MKRPLLGAAVALSASTAGAQVQPVGPAFQVNTYTTLPQRLSHVGSDSAGNVVVVWQSSGQDGNGWGVFGRRYDAVGAPLGPEFQANTYTTGHQEDRPVVAVDAAGNHTVAWANFAPLPPFTYELHGQRFDALGNQAGAEFQVNSVDHGWDYQPSIASDPAGNVVVVWHTFDGVQRLDNGLFGRRYDPSGAPVGAEFQIETYLQGLQMVPDVAFDGAGGFLVAWHNVGTGGHGDGFFVRRNTAGQFGGAEVQAASCPEADPFRRFRPSVAHLGAGRFVVAWPQPAFGNSVRAQVFAAGGAPATREVSLGGTTGIDSTIVLAPDGPDRFTAVWRNSSGILGRAFNADLVPISADFVVTPIGSDPAATRQAPGSFIVSWTGADASGTGIFARRFAGLRTELEPRDLALDGGGNGVLEPAETATVAPGWRNPTAAPIAVSGVLVGFTGPPGPTYTVVDPVAQYLVSPGQRADCTATGDCYSVSISASSRPAQHWDAAAEELLATGTRRSWALHVGDSFADVPRTRGDYRFVEGLLHAGVTGGCTSAAYCPDDAISREQMAVFLRVAREGPSACRPGACRAGSERFTDVPASSGYCSWIEELARFEVVGGCGGGRYCPQSPVTREEMAVFVVATREGPGYQPPSCIAGSERFADVPAASPYCRWIEELARRNVVTGCGGGLYCPTASVTRGDMSVFASVTFGLPLYGP